MTNAEYCNDLYDTKRQFISLYGSDVPNFWKALAAWLIEERN